MKQYDILMLDRQEEDVLTIKDMLKDIYSVRTTGDIDVFRRYLDKRKPDIIMLGVDILSEHRYDDFYEIKDRVQRSGVPLIILLNSRDFTEEDIDVFRSVALDYILKGVIKPLLLRKIELYLSYDSLAKETKKYAEKMKSLVEKKTNVVLEQQNSLLRTVADLVDFKDEQKNNHGFRSERYIEILLDALIRRGNYVDIIVSWDRDFLLQAVKLHDIGKITVDENILKKRDKLNADEFVAMKKHTTNGVAIIDKIIKDTETNEFLEHARKVIGSHHEWWDGTGYPNSLAGDEIPLEGRIMAVADVYDALLSERPYKKPFTHEHAVTMIMNGSGTQFDPTIVDAFLTVSDDFRKIFEKSQKL